MWATSATNTARVDSGASLDWGQVLAYYVLIPLALLVVIGALAWYTSTARQPGHYPVLRGRVPGSTESGHE